MGFYMTRDGPKITCMTRDLGPVQTLNFTCDEPNTYLGRPE